MVLNKQEVDAKTAEVVQDENHEESRMTLSQGGS